MIYQLLFTAHYENTVRSQIIILVYNRERD